MRLQVLGSVVAGMALFTTPAAADVRITMAGGHVTLSAANVTTREILAEWARVGRTRIVNLERVAGAPLSLELTNVAEEQALDIVLRTVSGYLAVPRASAMPDASRYDRIFLLPTSTGTPARAVPAAPSVPPPSTPPQFAPPDDQPTDDEAPRFGVPPPQPAAWRGAAFGTFPQPGPDQGRQQTAPAPNAPSLTPAPLGVATPGMVVPSPQPAGQPSGQQRGEPGRQQP